MNVKGVTYAQISEAAEEVGVRIYNYQDKGKQKMIDNRLQWLLECTFTLKTGDPRIWLAPLNRDGKAPKMLARFRRFSERTGHTIPGAVCWHGHRDFLRALFHLAPNATVKTAVAVYRGADNFEATYRATASSPSSWQSASWSQTVSTDNACSCVE